MTYLLDTNAASDYLRGIANVVAHIQRCDPDDLAISAVTVMELHYGCQRRRSKALTAAVTAFIEGITVHPLTADAARLAGTTRASLESRGIALSLADSQIAGHALAAHATLVTSDQAFRRVTGLKVVDWRKG